MVKQRRYWGLLPVMPAPVLAEITRQSEAMGLEGVWAPQLWSPPFLTLGAAAMVTERMKLGSGVALAFVRSPLETACAALDLDHLSQGRAVLGIGPSIRWWNEDWHGVRYGKPIPHLREVVHVIRTIIENGHTGELAELGGEYYKLNLSHFKTLTPPVRTKIPIYIPAVYETACRVAAEIGDGLPGHPIWCERWIRERVVPSVKKGLGKSGRKREDFDLNIWLFTAPGDDKRECIEDARLTTAFYAKFEQYRRYYAESGFEREAVAIHDAAQKGDENGMLAACPDDMVEHFCLVGPAADVRRRVDSIADVADSFTLCVPFYGLAPEKALAYNVRIAEAFYV